MTNLDRQLRRAIFKGKILSTAKTIIVNPKFLRIVSKLISVIFRLLKKRFL